MSLFVLGPLYGFCYFLRTNLHWHNIFILLFSDWKYVLILVLGTVWTTWMEDLETVNRASITFEEKTEWRLSELERTSLKNNTE